MEWLSRRSARRRASLVFDGGPNFIVNVSPNRDSFTIHDIATTTAVKTNAKSLPINATKLKDAHQRSQSAKNIFTSKKITVSKVINLQPRQGTDHHLINEELLPRKSARKRAFLVFDVGSECSLDEDNSLMDNRKNIQASSALSASIVSAPEEERASQSSRGAHLDKRSIGESATSDESANAHRGSDTLPSIPRTKVTKALFDPMKPPVKASALLKFDAVCGAYRPPNSLTEGARKARIRRPKYLEENHSPERSTTSVYLSSAWKNKCAQEKRGEMIAMATLISDPNNNEITLGDICVSTDGEVDEGSLDAASRGSPSTTSVTSGRDSVSESIVTASSSSLSLDQMEHIASEFKSSRIKRGFTQTDVSKLLASINPNLSQTTVSRFENLGLSYKNFLRLQPYFELFLNKVVECNVTSDPFVVISPEDLARLPAPAFKRYRRAEISPAMTRTLVKCFEANPRPSKEEIQVIVDYCRLEFRSVRNWFLNRRAKQNFLDKLNRKTSG